MNENDIQTLAVVDEDRHLKGLLTLGDIARFYIEDQDANALAEAKTSYRNLVDVLDGTLEVGDIDQRFEQGSVCLLYTSLAQLDGDAAADRIHGIEHFIERDKLVNARE